MITVEKMRREIVFTITDRRRLKVIFLSPINFIITLPLNLCVLFVRSLRIFAPDIIERILRKLLSLCLAFMKSEHSGAQRFLHSKLTLDDFFRELKKRDVEYVVLRWFENLPTIDKGEDIDILISDSDLKKIRDLFGVNIKRQSFDIYSVSGLFGSNFRKVPYFPPDLAKSILKSRRWHNDIYSVPDPKHHFLSLAYHAVFHKGIHSGLSNRNHPETEKTDHNYHEILKILAQETGYQNRGDDYIEYYELLKKEGWIPGLDTMRILSLGTHWLQDFIPKALPNQNEGEIIVFVIREWAITNNKLDAIVARIKEYFLDILDITILNQQQKIQATSTIRGGKWDRGAIGANGGLPAAFVVCYDYHPKPPSKKLLKKYPFINNKNVHIKHKIRNYFNFELLAFYQSNFIHSADDPLEAWHYIKNVIPEKAEIYRQIIEQRRLAYKTEFPIIHRIDTHCARAKIEKIDFHGRAAIKKTFRLGLERYADREANTYHKFSQLLPTIPPLLEQGSNYIIIPWYENILDHASMFQQKKLIKLHAKAIINTMKVFYEEGYAIIGFHPGNLLLTPSNGIKAIDFEFLYQYKNKPNDFKLSYDIAGVPKNFDGEHPRGTQHTYNNTWRPIFGPLKY